MIDLRYLMAAVVQCTELTKALTCGKLFFLYALLYYSLFRFTADII